MNKNTAISFNLKSGRITIFKTTLTALGYPEYYSFMFSPEDKTFGIEPCQMNDGGAHRYLQQKTGRQYSISVKALVRFVYETCGWSEGTSYRVPGLSGDNAVYFDLKKAVEIGTGRVTREE